MYLPVRTLALILVFFALSGVFTLAGNSPGFRGPAGDGILPERKAPTKWDRETNVKWKVALPAQGNSSPVVWGDAVFLTCAEDKDGLKRSLYCFERASGKQRWVRTIDFGRKMPSHQTNPYCASTPATDGQRVVVWHGSAGLYCYDFSGKQLWERDLGEFRHEWGYASSPVIYKDRVILNCGPGKRTFMTAINLASGETIWESPEKVLGEKRKDGGWAGSWATPVLAKIDGRDQFVCTMPTRVVGYDPQDGKVIWWCDGLSGRRGDLAYSSPMIAGDLCVAIGGYSGPGVGFKLGGTGDITDKNRLWRNERNPQSIGTGVYIGEHIYRPNAGRPGAVECMEPETGKIVWSALRGGGACWGSIVAVGETLYVTNQRGTTFVFKANPEEFEPIAENHLKEPSNSTPAICDGQIFIRTYENLYCIEE